MAHLHVGLLEIFDCSEGFYGKKPPTRNEMDKAPPILATATSRLAAAKPRANDCCRDILFFSFPEHCMCSIRAVLHTKRHTHSRTCSAQYEPGEGIHDRPCSTLRCTAPVSLGWVAVKLATSWHLVIVMAAVTSETALPTIFWAEPNVCGTGNTGAGARRIAK